MNRFPVCTRITHTTTQILFQPSVCRFSSYCCSIPRMKVFVSPKPHKLLLNRIQNCLFNIIQKLGNFAHTTLNRVQLSIYASSVSESTISNHTTITVFTTEAGLIACPFLPLRSFTLQSNLHFALTFCPM